MPLVWGLGVLIVLGAGFLWLRRRRPAVIAPAEDPGDVTQPLPAAPPAPEPEAFLLDLHGISDTPTLRITSRQLVVGRSYGTDTEHVDYFIVNKATVGRRHAIIKWKDGAFWLVDLGSVNGTYVNDERLLGERILRTGDRLRFHKFEFEFSAPGQVPARLDTRRMDQQTQLAMESTRIPGKPSRADLTDPGDFQTTGDFPAPSGFTLRQSAFELSELEADRDAFFSAPEAGDVNFEPRRVAGDDDMTYDDREARSLFDTLARREASPDPDATHAGAVPGGWPLDADATQAGPVPAVPGATPVSGTSSAPRAQTSLSGEDTAESDAFFASNTMTGFAADLMEDDRTFEVPLPVREEIRSATPAEMLATRVFDDASATGEFAPGDMERTLQVDATVIRQADFMETDMFTPNATRVNAGNPAPSGARPIAPADDDASDFFTDDPPPRR
jgi:predicted component of type VI protein secretion system